MSVSDRKTADCFLLNDLPPFSSIFLDADFWGAWVGVCVKGEPVVSF